MSIPYSLTFISVENGKDDAAVNKVYVDVAGLANCVFSPFGPKRAA